MGSVIGNSPSPSRWRDASALRLDQRVRCEYVGVRVPRQLLLRHLLEHGFWTPVLESALTQQLFPEIAWRQTGKAASTWIAPRRVENRCALIFHEVRPAVGITKLNAHELQQPRTRRSVGRKSAHGINSY